MDLNNKLSLKLLVDKKSNRVLFAEVGKDFVDFLFNLISLPIGIVIRLFESSKMVGSIGNLYSSVENLDETYLQQNRNKDMLLKPQLSASASTSPISMFLPEISRQSPLPTKKLYMCSNNHRCVTDILNFACFFCNHKMQYEARLISSESKAAKQEGGDIGGYVRGLVTYMVMDDLTVTPISMISGVAMMKKCSIQDFSSLEERVVECDTEECVEILKASLVTKEVLTSVFMTKELKLGVDAI